MTHAERTVILGVIADLRVTKNAFRSAMVGAARDRLQALVDGVRPTAARCSNTTSGAHLSIADLESDEEHCEGCDPREGCLGLELPTPELIDSTACLACGARL